MTVTPDPNQPPDQPPVQPPNQPPDDQDRPPEDQPAGAVTSVTAVTAAPDPAPTDAEGPGEDGHEVEVETTRAAAAHTVAYPSPIPDYAMETSVEQPAAAPPSDAVDPGPPTVPLTREPPYLAPEPPYPVAPVPAFRAATAPAAPVPAGAAGPAAPEASVRPRHRSLFGTILWGVILLALAGYVLLGVLVPAPADPTLWLLGGVVVIGLLLIVVGIIAALRRAG